MILQPPFEISPSLCAALRVGDSWISLLSAKAGEDRGGEGCHIASQDWGFEIFTPDFVYITDDLNTVHGDIVHAFDDFLCFLTCDPDIMPGDEPLFPPHVMEWAKKNEDELSMLRSDICDENGIARSDLIEM